MANAKISQLTGSTLNSGDYVPAYRSGVGTSGNYKLNLQSSIAEGVKPIYPAAAFGIVADEGVTNQRALIQAAIDEIYTAGGGTLLLDAGTYKVQDLSGIAILMKTGVKLKGAGIRQTIITTDNTAAQANYCLIAPFAYNTVTVPYTAHEIDIEDLTLTSTSFDSVSSPDNRLHNLIGFAHCPKGRATRVGFDTTAFHYAEFNYSKNIKLVDCETVGDGNHDTSKFQLDSIGACGQAASPRFTATISGSATYASGRQTLLTVGSTSSLLVNDHIVITSATGSSASSYNAVGGFKICNIVSSTTVAIDLVWPGNATTTGTMTVQSLVENIYITGYKDKPAASNALARAREFMDLSHTNNLGTFRNIVIDNCTITPASYTIDLGSTKNLIGFDNAALPIEFSGFRFTNNRIVGGGHSGWTILLNLNANYSATYNKVIKDIVIENNIVERTGMFSFLYIGDSPNTDGTARTSLTMVNGEPTHCKTFRNVIVRNNTVNVALRGGATSIQRDTRPFIFGGMDKLICQNNRVILENRAPEYLSLATWSFGFLYGFIFDHIRDCTVDSNSVEIYLDTRSMDGSPTTSISCHGFIFGCSAFELAASLTPSRQVWTNNSVYGYSANGTATNIITRGFTEILTAGTTGMSSWASTTNTQVKGIWQGNRVYSSPGTAADTCGGASYLNIPKNGSVGSAVVTAAMAESPDGSTNPGRHRWGYGPRHYMNSGLVSGLVTIADVLFNSGTIVNVMRTVTGGTAGTYSVTGIPGASFSVISSSNLDTSTVSCFVYDPS